MSHATDKEKVLSIREQAKLQRKQTKYSKSALDMNTIQLIKYILQLNGLLAWKQRVAILSVYGFCLTVFGLAKWIGLV